MNDNIKAAELLESAACVIQLPGWWTKDVFARNNLGRETEIAAKDACKFCVVGAITASAYESRVDKPVIDKAIQAVAQIVEVPEFCVSDFNDDCKTSKTPARKMLEAADMLRNQS